MRIVWKASRASVPKRRRRFSRAQVTDVSLRPVFTSGTVTDAAT